MSEAENPRSLTDEIKEELRILKNWDYNAEGEIADLLIDFSKAVNNVIQTRDALDVIHNLNVICSELDGITEKYKDKISSRLLLYVKMIRKQIKSRILVDKVLLGPILFVVEEKPKPKTEKKVEILAESKSDVEMTPEEKLSEEKLAKEMASDWAQKGFPDD